ncbi:MAG: DUF308 domain-containing protein [Holdemanella sp.]|nr:DUF308 domain-containing protein [Holdemanella sp.]
MKTLAKIALVVIGILFIGMGFSTFFMPEATLVAYSWVSACMFVAGGIMSIIVFFQLEKGFPLRAMFLVQGIIQAILGFMLLSNGMIFTTIVALNVFQIWIVFSGIEDIVGSFTLKDMGIKNWWLTLILGILSLVIGLSSFASAIFSTAFINASVAMGLLFTGASMISRAFTKEPEKK